MQSWLQSSKYVKAAQGDDVFWDSSRKRVENTAKEFFGTLMLTTVTAGSVLASGQLSIKFDLVELTTGRIFCIALANAFIYAALQMPSRGVLAVHTTDGKVRTFSGYFREGHFNPATSIACAIMRQIDWTTALYYATAQLVGAVIGCLMLWLIWFPLAPPESQFGATVVSSDASVFQALSAEILLSYVFHMILLALCAVHNDNQASNRYGKELEGVLAFTNDANLVPLLVAFVKLVCLVIGISISGGSLNPARSFGPAVVSGYFENHWIFWLGPLTGASLAAVTLRSLK